MSPNTTRYLSIDAVCARLERTRPTVMKIIEHGDLAAIKFGGSWGVSPEAFEEYLASAAEAERKKNADLGEGEGRAAPVNLAREPERRRNRSPPDQAGNLRDHDIGDHRPGAVVRSRLARAIHRR